jgi:hypothetical protein
MYNFTTDELVLHLHQQLPAHLAAALQAALLTDWALRQKFQLLQEAQQSLQALRPLKPRRKAVLSILKHLEKKEMV